jgi:hypothetical protein
MLWRTRKFLCGGKGLISMFLVKTQSALNKRLDGRMQPLAYLNPSSLNPNSLGGSAVKSN